MSVILRVLLTCNLTAVSSSSESSCSEPTYDDSSSEDYPLLDDQSSEDYPLLDDEDEDQAYQVRAVVGTYVVAKVHGKGVSLYRNYIVKVTEDHGDFHGENSVVFLKWQEDIKQIHND